MNPLADYQILNMIRGRHEDMVKPFVDHKENHNGTAISYGLTSFGYDLRLSPNEFFIFRHVPGTIIDPKSFNKANLEQASLVNTPHGIAFVIPGNSYALGVSLEYLHIPDNVITICVGKSSYARCGLIVNVTPFEPGWKGHPTLEISNCSSADAYVYANEGICQIMFFKGYTPLTGYGNGKYQDQPHKVVVSRVQNNEDKA